MKFALFISIAAVLAAQRAQAANTTIYIIRHGEKTFSQGCLR